MQRVAAEHHAGPSDAAVTGRQAPQVTEVEDSVELDEAVLVRHHPSTVFAKGDQRVTDRKTCGPRPPHCDTPSVPKGYVILTEEIHDRAGMDAYGTASTAPLLEHGGRVLVVDEDVDVLEGTWHGSRTVVVEFESVEKAREWYQSPSYQAALPIRQAASRCNVVIASGFELPASP